MSDRLKQVLSPDPWPRQRKLSWPVARVLCAATMTAALAGALGCEKTLIKDGQARSQYDQYDTIRNQHAQQYIVDEFGKRRPNLRGRLSPRSP